MGRNTYYVEKGKNIDLRGVYCVGYTYKVNAPKSYYGVIWWIGWLIEMMM